MANPSLEELQARLDAAAKETEAVRQKLHNAVRKGKAIDADRRAKESELEALRAELQLQRERSQCVESPPLLQLQPPLPPPQLPPHAPEPQAPRAHTHAGRSWSRRVSSCSARPRR